jgi:hypothetical protein
MAEQVSFSRTFFNPEQYKKTIDTQFSELVPVTGLVTSSTAPVDVNAFFIQYNNIFYNIPATGSTNSHEYLIQQSAAYLGLDLSPDNVQDLIDEITQLREENLELQQQLFELSNILTPSASVSNTINSNINVQ